METKNSIYTKLIKEFGKKRVHEISTQGYDLTTNPKGRNSKKDRRDWADSVFEKLYPDQKRSEIIKESRKYFVFNKNIPATELILRIILKRNIRVTSVEAQEEMRSPIVGGRDITLDIHAIDENGEEINVEVQGSSEGAHVRRARFHSAVMDSRMLKENDPFKILKDSYVIFIYKHDKFGKGLPIYRAERVISDINEPLNDGSHIVYVNGNYKENDEIGKLMADFRSTSSEGMNFKELADGLHHFKETEEGRDV